MTIQKQGILVPATPYVYNTTPEDLWLLHVALEMSIPDYLLESLFDIYCESITLSAYIIRKYNKQDSLKVINISNLNKVP